MALTASYNTSFGFTQPDAYIRVSDFRGNRLFVDFNVTVHMSLAAKDAGSTFIGSGAYRVPYVDGMSMSMLYAYLKTMPEFAGAIDA